MTTHVAIQVSPRNFDGGGLTNEIRNWLIQSIGYRCYDMTSLKWSRRSCWYVKFSQYKVDPTYITGDGDKVNWLHFYFRSPSQAALFKLAWG